MTTLLNAVGHNVNPQCLATRKLKKKGRQVGMDGAPAPRLVIDFDKPGAPLAENEQRCDYLVVAADQCTAASAWVVALELKHGQLRASKATEQLRAGAQAAAKLIPPGAPVRFRPVVVYGKIHRAEIRKLRQQSNRIEFHGQKQPARLMKCGDELAKALDD